MSHRAQSLLCTVFCLCVLVPGTLLLGSRLPGRWYYLTATLMVMEGMIPFFFAFESRRPQARELVTVGVLAALAAVSRGAFAFLPHFKPIVAIVMVAGIAYGGEVGFLTGAISAFASNFFFGQGPFTPWQMLSYGMAGFLAGILFGRLWKKQGQRKAFPILLALAGFLTVILVVGPILDACTLFTMMSQLSWATAIACFSSGFFVNLTHSISVAITLLLIGKPFLEKLTRLQTKYGIWHK